MRILLFTLLLSVISVSSLFAQNQEWNISSDDFNALGELTSDTTISGLSIYATAEKTVTVDGNEKTVGDLMFTHRLKLGGSGSMEADAEYRIVTFDVTGDATISVAAMSSSSGSDRELALVNGIGDTLTRFPAMGASIDLVDYEYVGDSTTLTLVSTESGVNIYYVKTATAEVVEPTTPKVAYVNNVDLVMAETAAQPDNDPIIQMLAADENIELDVLLIAADSVVDLSGYDVVIAQEGFSSSAAIYKQGGTLGMGSIPVPFILNKAYTMKAGRGFAADTPGSGGEVEGTLYLTASAANQTNPLFTGITFDGDSSKVFFTGGADNGDDSRTKGLQYATDVVISVENTLLASGVNDPENATVCVNDIPSGTIIGSETLQARMIAVAMNYGAICKDGGNLTTTGMTLWRNAVYSLAGLDIPSEPVVVEEPVIMTTPKVAYVNNVDLVMAETAAQPDNDPIIQMLAADENIELDVLLIAADSVVDLSGYDVVIAQEGFSSSAAIYKQGGTLGMGSIPVPFILNKAYTMKAGRGFAADTPGSGGEVEGTLYLTASAANQTNPLFTGITFDGDSSKVFFTGGADNGDDSRTKGLQYATDVVISVENTLLASGVNDPENATVCVNDIPSGTIIGSETLQARMIAVAMNYGAICKDGGNLTTTGMTLWRNAVYSLAGLDIPSEPIVVEEPVIEEPCVFEPFYSEIENLVVDPECTDLSLWQGWGLKTVVSADSAYCGETAFLLSDPTGEGCKWPDGSAALDVADFTWQAGSTYHLRVMVKTVNGPIGFLAKNSVDNGAGDFGFGIDTEGEWMQIDTMFTTSADAGTGFYSFNTCDFNSTATETYVDNYELYLVEGPVAAKEVVFVKIANDVNQWDSLVIANIDNYMGGDVYDVTVVDQSVITEDLLPTFNAADLVIMGRSLPSGDVASGTDVWNAITAPVLSMNMWGMRSSRALWTPSASCSNIQLAPDASLMGTVLMPNDPVFEGLSGTTFDWWTGSYSAFGADAEGDDAGNGTLLAATPDGAPLYMRWEAGEMYPGGSVAAGPRSYIGNGSDNDWADGAQRDNYFGFTEITEQIFWNEMARITGGEIKPIEVATKGIVFVKVANDVNQWDSLVIANIDNYMGGDVYDVTVVDQSVITEDLLPTFNAADVVIMGRSLPSGDVASGTDVWNAITAPVLSMNMWGMRSSRALWTPSSSCENLKNDEGVYIEGTILMPDDPVFAGMSETTIDWWSGNHSAFGVDAEGDDFGNGMLLAATPDGRPLYMRWEAGEMYTGGSVAAGPRSYIGNGSDDGGVVNYFSWSGTSKQIFWNELARISGGALNAIQAGSGPSIADKNIIFVTDDDMDNEQIEWLESFGASVTIYYEPAGLAAAPAGNIDALNAADLIIVGRSPNSGDFDDPDKVAWNGITTPMIFNSQWSVRSSRVNMFNSTSAVHFDTEPDIATADIADATDPAFSLISVSDGKLEWCNVPHDFLTTVEETNGTVLAQWDQDATAPLFVRFEAGVEYYPGSIDMPAGPRTYFGFGNDATGVVNFFPLTENARLVYLAEILNMLGLPIEIPVVEVIKDPLTIFDPADVDESTLPEGMSIVDMDGAPYLQVVLDGWNSNLPISEYTILEPGMAAVCDMKYALGDAATYTAEQVNAVVQLMDTVNLVPASWDPNSMIPAALGLAQNGTDASMYFASGSFVDEVKIIHNIQFFGQETVSWGPTTGDTIWVGKVRAQYLGENVIFDPRNVDTSDENVSIVEIDGEMYAKVILDGWNSVLRVPTFNLEEGMMATTNFKYEISPDATYSPSQVNAVVQLMDLDNLVPASWDANTLVPADLGLIQEGVKLFMTEVSGTFREEMKLVHQIQLFGQETVTWGPTTGDVMIVGKVVAAAAPVYAPITFVVDDSKLKKYDGFSIRGSWVTETGAFDIGWNGGVNHAQFTDDDGDNIWDLTIDMISDGGVNTWKWGFVDLADNWLVTTADLEFQVIDETPQTLTYTVGGTGVDALSSNLKVYPNPTSGVLNVSGVDVRSIEVYNLSGAKVISNHVSNNSIDVSNLTKGSYIVKVINAQGGFAMRKFNKR